MQIMNSTNYILPDDYSPNIIKKIEEILPIIRWEREQLTPDKIQQKNNDPTNPVTESDTLIQQQYKQRFQNQYPNIHLIGEEDNHTNTTISQHNRIIALIDPIDGTNSFIDGRLWQVTTLITLYHQQSLLAVFIGNVGDNTILYYDRHTPYWSVQLLDLHTKSQNIISYDEAATKQPILILWHNRSLQDISSLHNTITHASQWVGGSRSHAISQLCRNLYSAVILEPWTKEPRDRLPMMWLCQQLWYDIYHYHHDQRVQTIRNDYIYLQTRELTDTLLIGHPHSLHSTKLIP